MRLFERAEGFWRTADSGKTGVRVALSCGDSGIYRATNGVLYAGAMNAVLRSADGGHTWIAVSPCGQAGWALLTPLLKGLPVNPTP